MNESTGVSAPPPPDQTPGMSGDEPSGDVSDLLQAKVRTLGDLKQTLIAHLGEEQGTKFYNSFMSSFGLMLFQQLQSANQRAEEAAKKMREQP
jgi:hypothetical protein